MTDDDLQQPERPAHTRLAPLLVVFLGGTLGTASRALVSRAVSLPAHLPLATFAINIVGALLLGLLLGRLAAAGPDRGRRLLLRLTAGTGFLGGFTTYSALAVDTATLTAGGRWGWGLAYAVSTLLAGVGAAALGLSLGGRRRAG